MNRRIIVVKYMFYLVSDEVITDVYMLASLMLFWVIGECNCRFIVRIDCLRCVVLPSEFFEKVPVAQRLFRCHGKCKVLCFCCAKRDASLLLRSPRCWSTSDNVIFLVIDNQSMILLPQSASE